MCTDMKKITVDKIIETLKNNNYEVELNKNLIENACRPLENMLKLVE